jgi:hypothetical protein
MTYVIYDFNKLKHFVSLLTGQRLLIYDVKNIFEQSFQKVRINNKYDIVVCSELHKIIISSSVFFFIFAL